MVGKPKYSDAEIAELIHKNAGIRAMVWRAMGCTRQNLERRIGKSPELQKAERDTRDHLLDVAQYHLIRAVSQGDSTTTRWYLRRFSKDRGYGKDNDYVSVGRLRDQEFERFLIEVGGSVEKYRAAMDIKP